MDEPFATGNTAGASVVLFYCERCGLRVPMAELAAGKAKRTDDTHAICGACCAPASKAASAAIPSGTRRESRRLSATPDRGAGVSFPVSESRATGIQFRRCGSGAQSRKSAGALVPIGIGAGYGAGGRPPT